MLPARVPLRVVCVALLALAFPAVPSSQSAGPGQDAPVIGVLGIATEIASLERILTGATAQTISGTAFTAGMLNGHRVVVGRSGVGKVNAAVAATLLVDRFKPGALFFSGTAGALDPALGPGDVIIGTALAQHDVGVVTSSGFTRRPTRSAAAAAPNPLFVPAANTLLEAARRAARQVSLRPIETAAGPRRPVIREGTIVTGDVFVMDERLRDELRALGAAAVEMEGAAVAQVCWQIKLSCLIVRSITDGADRSAADRYQQFLAAASENAAMVVAETIRQLAGVRQPTN